MNIVRRANGALVAVALLLWPIAADAQLSKVGAPFVTPGGASAYSRTSDTGYDSTHQVFLTVVSEHKTAPGGRVNASFANANGTVLTSAFRVDSTGKFPFGPALAYSPEDDVFLVVWRVDGGQVRGRLVRYGVNALGSADFAVSGTGVAASAFAPAVAYSPTSQEFLVAYTNGGTRVARVSTSGAVIGLPVLASVPAASGYHWTESPALAWNPTNNEFLLAYAQELSPGWQIRARRISAGQLVGGMAAVHAAGKTTMPDVQYSTQAGKYLVTWFQFSPYGIYGRMLNADASVAGSPQPMLPSNYGSYDANSLALQLVQRQVCRGDHHAAICCGRRHARHNRRRGDLRGGCAVDGDALCGGRFRESLLSGDRRQQHKQPVPRIFQQEPRDVLRSGPGDRRRQRTTTAAATTTATATTATAKYGGRDHGRGSRLQRRFKAGLALAPRQRCGRVVDDERAHRGQRRSCLAPAWTRRGDLPGPAISTATASPRSSGSTRATGSTRGS